MRAWRAAVVTISIAAPLVGLTVMIGCDLGSPASPVAPPLQEASVVICPTLDPTFDSIRTNLLATDTCGSDRGGKCHSSGGATYSGGLDYTVDASALYEEFLGDSGTGHKAQNIAGSATDVFRVVPGDSGASLLYIKLVTHTKTDPQYGSGMPQDYPGAMCPDSVAAVQQWIDNGAKFVEIDSGPVADAGEISDGSAPDASDASDD
jgi:hypothetical protein